LPTICTYYTYILRTTHYILHTAYILIAQPQHQTLSSTCAIP
jgi:hypothetical protein